MLARIWRLTNERDFNFMYRRGRRWRAQGFTLYYWYNPTLTTHTQFGVVVSKRVSGLATERNLYKRRLWAALSVVHKKFPSKGAKLVLVAGPTIVNQPYGVLCQQIKGFLNFLHYEE